MIRWTVEPGEVVINGGEVVADYRRVKVVEFGLTSKYPGECYYGLGPDPGQIAVFVPAGERTLNLDEGCRGEATAIQFAVPGGGWSVFAEGTRYTVRVVLYRRPSHPLQTMIVAARVRFRRVAAFCMRIVR